MDFDPIAQKEHANNPLHDIRTIFDPYDRTDALATAAALQLVPENADRLIRIEAVAHTISSLPPAQGKPKISAPRIRNLLNSPPLSDQVAMAEDPFPNPFVEEIAFFGGSYRVFPGLTDGATYVMSSASVIVRNRC